MTKFTRIIYIVLFILIILMPHLGIGHFFPASEKYMQSLFTIVILMIVLGIYLLHQRDIRKKEKEKQELENQFSFSFADKVSRYVSLGVGLKIYYYRLFEKVSSTNLGVDIGTPVRLTERLTLGIAVQDINSKYKWDTSNLYGEQGNSTTEKFPLLRKIGASYSLSDYGGVISLELENSNSNTNIIRLGGEIDLSDQISLRAGIDHWDVKQSEQASPTFGFSVKTSIDEFTPALNYAYVVEPYGLFAMHIISLSTRF